MLKNNFLLFVFTLSFNIILSQYKLLNLTTKDGLKHDITYNIFQDSKGYLWIGTDDGLSKFDGKNFKNFSLEDGLITNYVTDITEISNDYYAIATWGGGIHFLKNDSIYKPKYFNDNDTKIFSIYYYEDKIYTTSSNYILIYDLLKKKLNKLIYTKNRGLVKNIISGDSIEQLQISILDSSIVLHSKDGKKSTFLGLKKFDKKLKLLDAFKDLNNKKINTFFKKNSTYYFVSNEKLYIKKNKERFIEYSLGTLKQTEYISKLVVSKDDQLFLITTYKEQEKKLYSFDLKTKKLKELTKDLGIQTSISDILIDFEGSLWISTYGNGLLQYNVNILNFENILKGDNIIDLKKFNDKIYALTPSNVYEIKNKKLVTSYGNFGTGKKLSIVDNKLYISSLNLNSKKKINDDIFLISGSFFEKIDDVYIRQCDTIFFNSKISKITNELKLTHGIYKDSIITLYTNKGRWLYNYKNSFFKKDYSFKLINNTEKINEVIELTDKIILATDRGVVLKINGTESVINEDNGIANERINCITYFDNTLFVGTQDGLSVISNYEVLNYNKSHGITSNTINSIKVFNREIWIGGNEGISIIQKKDLRKYVPPKLNVKHTDNLKFDYNAISLLENKSLRVQYKINNSNWLDLPKSKGEIKFNNFAYDNYKIVFRARGANTPWTFTKVFDFTIKRPWYKQWNFILFSILIISFLIAFLNNKIVKKIKKRNLVLQKEIEKRVKAEEELNIVRENIARDFHDDLGNKLASISLLSEVLAKKTTDKQSTIANTIKEDANYLYKGTKDFIFSLKQKSNQLQELIIYLTDFSEDFLFQLGIDFDCQNLIKEQIILPNYWSKQIIFIYKEAITNISKHANATFVSVSFSIENNLLSMIIKDNGIGFDFVKVRKRGLQNMLVRAEKINCSIELKTNQKGTKIIFKGKLVNENK